jgi:hypothetical protein
MTESQVKKYHRIKRPIIAAAIIGLKLSNAARRAIFLWSLSPFMRGDLSLFTGMYYKAG